MLENPYEVGTLEALEWKRAQAEKGGVQHRPSWQEPEADPARALAPKPQGRSRREASGPLDKRPVSVRMADVVPESVRWLWRPYIPLGKLTLLEGDPGLGKSWATLAVASAVTRGAPMPEQAGYPASEGGEPANVLLLSGEDGLADTVVVRLKSLGADLTRVVALTGWRAAQDDGREVEGVVTLDDAALLRAVLDQHHPRLLVVDPLVLYLGAAVDLHRANETRPVLAALGGLAQEYGAAVVAIRHLRKSSADRAAYRGVGSIDLTAAARSVLLVAAHPDDAGLRVLAHVKSSLAPKGAALGFRLDDGAFYWTGTVDLDAEALLAPPVAAEERSARAEARDFLEELLSDGPAAAVEVKREARAAGVAERTLRRAADELGVHKRRLSEGNRGAGAWIWERPIEDVGHVANLQANAVTDASAQRGQGTQVNRLPDQLPGSKNPQDGNMPTAPVLKGSGRLPAARAEVDASPHRSECGNGPEWNDAEAQEILSALEFAEERW